MRSDPEKKKVSLEELAGIVENLRAEGKTVAHCHGCFDLMHPGHIKHFESAGAQADVLIVTLTPDRFVNKGPGRPVFNEQLRQETISSLECVDYVAINKWPTAIELLKLIKPSYYVKGQEYADASKDLTGNIALEEEAVKEGGGSLIFTNDIVFSSSNLINAHFNPLDEKIQEYLETLKVTFSAKEAVSAINSLSDLNVLVIGDTIIDEYHYVVPTGKSTKSANVSTKFVRAENYAGGTLAIANHLAQFAKSVKMVSLLGENFDRKDLITKKLDANIEPKFFERKGTPTVTKRKYLSTFKNTKVFAVTFMDDSNLESELENQIKEYLGQELEKYDLVLIADFGHGFITPGIQKFLEENHEFVCVNAQTNSNNYGFNYITKYRNTQYISIDENELRLPFGSKHGKLEQLILQLSEITGCDLINITLGTQGAIIYENGKFHRGPVLSDTVLDSVGAGDAVLSVSSLLARKGVPAELMVFINNCVGGIAVNILGNERPVNKAELSKFITHILK